jgi:AraC-like DNA-binding protein
MDAAAAEWYFSTMAGRGRERPSHVAFAPAKYGRTLLVDAGPVSDYDGFDRAGLPHVLDFFDILLVTTGSGFYQLDDESYAVKPGTVFLTNPGQVRRCRVPRINGACIFFREEFVAEAFSDPRFLDQFAMFRPTRPTGSLCLTPAEQRRYLRHYAVMRREIAALRSDAGHALRAALYELLVWLNRLYVARFGDTPDTRDETVFRFQALVDRDIRRAHRVGAYAKRVGVSPGHLNALCRTHLRRSASRCIRERLILEAKRLLLYSDATATQIAQDLGFADPSYFVRFFRREAGLPPGRFRRRGSAAATDRRAV